MVANHVYGWGVKMAFDSGLQVIAISVGPLPSNSGNVSSPLATQVQSVSNGAASSGPQASGVAGPQGGHLRCLGRC